MNYLAIDTSGDYLSVVLKIGEKTHEFFTFLAGVKQSEKLMVAIEEAFSALNAKPCDVDVFAAVTGPGSFTGIRIGVATIKGFADALNKKVLGVTVFDALSYTEVEGKILTVVNANHGNFYVAGFTDGKESFAPKFVCAAEFEELLKEYSPIAYEEIPNVDVKVVSVKDGLKKAVEKNMEKASGDTDSVKPFYLRLSQAEEGRK